MIEIWYLLHCQKQNEWEDLEACRRNLSRIALKDAFIFTYDRMRKFKGEWHLERQLLFPECVFLESEDKRRLSEELKEYKKAKLLPVRKSEEMFLSSLCGKDHHLAMSRGVIQDGITWVIEGPLRGWEDSICRIDRHKRLARLAAPKSFAPELTKGSISAGLEIVEKR